MPWATDRRAWCWLLFCNVARPSRALEAISESWPAAPQLENSRSGRCCWHSADKGARPVIGATSRLPSRKIARKSDPVCPTPMISGRRVATTSCWNPAPVRTYPSRFSRRRKTPDSFEVVVQNAIDDPKRMCPFLGGDLTDDKVDRIGQPQRIRPRRRPLAVGVERVSIPSFLRARLLSRGCGIRRGGVWGGCDDQIFICRRHDNRFGRARICRGRIDPMGAKRVAGQRRAIWFLCRGGIRHASLSPWPAPWLAASNSRTTWSAL